MTCVLSINPQRKILSENGVAENFSTISNTPKTKKHREKNFLKKIKKALDKSKSFCYNILRYELLVWLNGRAADL